MKIGYARVSSKEQKLDLQIDALNKEGCTKVFTDTISGAKSVRTGLEEALDYLRKDDILVVWRLDRLGRSLKHLIEVVSGLKEKEIGFKSITENIDTTTTGGMLIFNIFGSLAEFEREIIKERTNAGLAAARARGKKGGRPPIMDAKKVAYARLLLSDPNNSIDEVCKLIGVGRTTLYRGLKKYDTQNENK